MDKYIRVGIDAGTYSFKVSIIKDERVSLSLEVPVNGNPNKAVKTIISIIEANKNKDIQVKVGVCGARRELFNNRFYISENDSLSIALKEREIDVNSVLDIGSLESRYYLLSDNKEVIKSFKTSACAGGSGSIFESQAGRLNCDISAFKAHKLGKSATISGHCAVFAKSDIIHRGQEGYSNDEILSGIAYAIIRNNKSVLIRNNFTAPILLLGAGSKLLFLKSIVSTVFNVDEEYVKSDESNIFLLSIGAALKANKELKTLNSLLSPLKGRLEDDLLPPIPYLDDSYIDKSCYLPLERETDVLLGLDIGSTTVKGAFITSNKTLIDSFYIRSEGRAREKLLSEIERIKQKHNSLLNIKVVGITGSGRYSFSPLFKAAVIHDEITAQAKGATFLNKEIDTIFEIGGQDSKFISLENGSVKEFEMNRICASGTGAFLDEVAERLNLTLDEFIEVAFTSKSPLDIGERCTVFMTRRICELLSLGKNKEDIASAAIYSVINNYLDKVVMEHKVGDHILLSGGICYNRALVSLFLKRYPTLKVNKYFPISGAIGAALLAEEKVNEKVSINWSNENLKWEKESSALLSKYFVKNEKKEIGVPLSLMMYRLLPTLSSFFKLNGFSLYVEDSDVREDASNAPSELCFPIKLYFAHVKRLIDEGIKKIILPYMGKMKDSYIAGCIFMQSIHQIVINEFKEFPVEFIPLDMSQKAEDLLSQLSIAFNLELNKEVIDEAIKEGREFMLASKEISTSHYKKIAKEEKKLVVVTRAYNIKDRALAYDLFQKILRSGFPVLTQAELPLQAISLDEYPSLLFGENIVKTAKIIKNDPTLYPIYITNHWCAEDSMLFHLFSKEIGERSTLNIEIDEHFSSVGQITRLEAFLNAVKSSSNCLKQEAKKPAIKNEWYSINIYPYSEVLKSNLKELEIKTLATSPLSAIKKGRSLSISKEYFPFLYLLGLTTLENNNANLFLPLFPSYDADGAYESVIKAHTLYSPASFFPIEHVDSFIKAIFASDLILSAPKDKRDYYANIFKERIITEELIVEVAREISTLYPFTSKAVAISGDHLMLLIDELNYGIINEVEKKYRVVRAPLVELYLSTPQFNNYTPLLSKLSKIYGSYGPFMSPVALSSYSPLKGVCASYRYKKRLFFKERHIHSLVFAPMYENTETILSLLSKDDKREMVIKCDETTKPNVDDLFNFLKC